MQELSKETIERIERDATAFSLKKGRWVSGHYNTEYDIEVTYNEAATAEALRSRQLEEALDLIIGRCNGVMWEGMDARQAISKIEEYAKTALNNTK